MSAISMKSFAFVAAVAVGLGACQAAQGSASTEVVTPRSLVMSFDQGQLVTLSATINRDGEDAAAARQQYFQRVFPIAGSLGLSRDGTLAIHNAVAGEFEPEAYSFFSWPSAQAEAELNAHESWQDIKALRPVAWDELRLYSVEMEDDVSLTFREDRAYSIAVAWTNPEQPDSYFQYLDAIEPTLTETGARYLYKMRNPRFEQHATPGGDPAQVTFVEWQSARDLERFLRSQAYRDASHLLTNGVTRFEVQLVSPVLPAQAN